MTVASIKRGFGLLLLSSLLTASAMSTLPGICAAASDKFIDDAWKEMATSPQPSERLMNELATLAKKDPTNYQAHYLLAQCYQRIGLPEESLAELKLASQYGPNDPAPIVNLIREAAHLGQRDLAAQVSIIAYQKFPHNPEVQFWQGNFMLQRVNRLRDAEILFGKAMKSGQHIPGMKLSLATLRMAQGRDAEALHLANEQLKETPNAPGVRLLQGEIYMRRKDYNSAYPFLKDAYKKLVFSPNLARSYAQAAFWTGHYEDAMEPAIVEMALSSTRDRDDRSMERLFKEAALRVPKNKVREIVQQSSKTLDSYGHYLRDPSFHRTTAECLSEIGMHDLAATEYERCLQRDPSDAVARFLHGRELELYLGRYDEALADYQSAKRKYAPVDNIDLYIEHLEARIRSRQNDIAWQLKDWLRGNK